MPTATQVSRLVITPYRSDVLDEHTMLMRTFVEANTWSRLNTLSSPRADAVENGEQEVADRAAEALAALDTGAVDAEEALLDDDDDDGPAATVHQNSDTGAVELDIDISVLDRPRPPAIVTRLLGSNWLVRAWPDVRW